jgi:hypothetical protein
LTALAETRQEPRVASAGDVATVTRILVDAFADDPMWGAWAFPDPATRRSRRSGVFRLLVEGALRYPWLWLIADAAAAVWIPRVVPNFPRSRRSS